MEMKIGDTCYYTGPDGDIYKHDVNVAASDAVWIGALYGRSLKKAVRDIDESFRQSMDWREKGPSTRAKAFAGLVIIAVALLFAWASGGVGMIVAFFLFIFLGPLWTTLLGQVLFGDGIF